MAWGWALNGPGRALGIMLLGREVEQSRTSKQLRYAHRRLKAHTLLASRTELSSQSTSAVTWTRVISY